MKIYLIFILILLFSGCGGNIKLPETSAEQVNIKEQEKISYWLDEETSTVHKMISTGKEKKIVSIIKYSNGKPLEVMKIIMSSGTDGKFHWAYFVPSTKYIVEITAVLTGDNKINFDWKNRNSEGEEDYGSDIFIECNEHGVIRENGSKDLELLN